jgi:hypothetical protein
MVDHILLLSGFKPRRFKKALHPIVELEIKNTEADHLVTNFISFSIPETYTCTGVSAQALNENGPQRKL